METNDPLPKKRSGSLFSNLICGGKEAAAAGGESSVTAVEEGRKTDGNAKVKASNFEAVQIDSPKSGHISGLQQDTSWMSDSESGDEGEEKDGTVKGKITRGQ